MPNDAEITLAVRALKIGNKVRELRHKHRNTLQDLAIKTGLSKPFLSQIENDHVVPPVATLLRLARALNVTMAHFFRDQDSGEKVSVTRKHERLPIERRPHQYKGEVNYQYEALETHRLNKQMEPYLVRFGPQETSGMAFMSHDGEEFLYLLEGRLEFRTGDRVEILEAGDTLYFESDVSHSFRCLGDEAAEALVVAWSPR
jgi:transcriptional regulator with XRE-family HTH domain